MAFAGLRCYLVAALCVGLLGFHVPPEDTTDRFDPSVQVFTQKDLQASGVYHLSDIFWLVDDWSVQSVDGYGWEASPGGLTPLGQPGWVLVVDGQPVDLQALGRQHIDQLPLRVDELDRVEVHSGPSWVAGRPALQGALHLITRSVPEGLHAFAQVTPGSEIGDPGPFEFTGEDDTNVDRKGPLIGATGSTSWRGLSGRVGVKSDERHADNFIRPRVRRLCRGECIFRGAPVMRQTSLHAEAQASTNRSAHRLRAYDSTMDEQLFYEPVGMEVPSETRFRLAQATGQVTFGEAVQGSYEGTYTSHDLGRVAALPGFALQEQHFGGRLAVAHQNRGSVGIDVRWRDREAPSIASDRSRTTRLTAQSRVQPTARWQQLLAGALQETDGSLGFEAWTATQWSLSSRNSMRLTLAAGHLPAGASADGLSNLLRSGFELTGPDDRFDPGTLTIPSEVRRTTQLSADAQTVHRLHPLFRLRTSLGWRYADGISLMDVAAELQPGSQGVRTDITLPNGTGHILRGGLRLEGRALTPLGLGSVQPSAFVRYQTTTNADATFTDAWASQPAWRLGGSLTVTPVDRLTLFARVLYKSATSWPGYAKAAADAPGQYLDRLPPRWLVHLTAQKAFFRDHFRFSVSLRDVAQKPTRYHPAGAPIDMGFFVSFRAQL